MARRPRRGHARGGWPWRSAAGGTVLEPRERPDLPNIVGIRKRTFDEVIEYIIDRYPDMRFGVSYNGDGQWSAMAYYPDQTEEPVFIDGEDPETLLTFVVSALYISRRDQ